MNSKEILDYVDFAIMQIENVNIVDLPDNLRQDFSEAYGLLLHISTVLEMGREMEGDE